nr:MAG TPA: hypothetical protein [Bacteriophage sp.]
MKRELSEVLFLSFLDKLKSKCYFIIKRTTAPLMSGSL